jgi:hypothetical protein
MKHQVPVFIPGSQLVSNSEVPNRGSPNTYKYFTLFLKTVQNARYVKKSLYAFKAVPDGVSEF